ncbi:MULTISPECIES: ATP-dependent DNA helicase [Romboutsia]|jgi:DNA excision repair protein ERCC-2|uniref:ATP-dependent DNA helicase n=1 Tax=Romboutsia TaxID=1501226 RepID=UPI002172A100|nr:MULTISPECIES: ATP-dependent DNA helicase [Romboutsia]MCI9061947.1 ATP-dependent DNA helicase [Romboutsia sp.]
MNKTIKISIRNLVEFIMRHGSIDNRYTSSIKAIEGIRGHQRVQKSYGDNYTAEVPLKYKLTYEDLEIIVEGRADGILIEDDKTIIDEIKTTTKDLLLIDENTNPLHWAQAKCYGYIYSMQNELENIDIQITYYNIDTKSTRILRQSYTLKDLEEFFFWLIDEYKSWAQLENDWVNKRNKSIKELKFPFENYRPGQRELAVRVYKSIIDSKKCFAQAPTGTGKTISTLFPAIKAMGENETSKIFYLTAKTITREVAQNTISLMRKKDLNLKSVTITAKEKICKMEEVNCNPEYCPYANGYFDRINNSLKDILAKYNDYSKENIEKISEEYMLCPFELSLDLTNLSDVIICDYNYVFDPRVYLKRFFDTKTTNYTFLIDEAHNLVDRAREMYSATLNEEKFIKVKKLISKKDKRITRVIKEIQSYFEDKLEDLTTVDENDLVESEAPLELCEILSSFIKFVDEYLARTNEENEELMDLYFDVYSFLSISDFYDKNYTTIYTKTFNGMTIKIYCVNPQKVIEEKMKKAKSNIIFSATLIPMDYFMKMYSYDEEDFIINLKSPFDVNNRLLMIGDNVATTYNKRFETSEDIASYIANCVQAKKGNYMVFFPSYKYMELVFDKMKENYPDINTSIQESNMSEEEKEEFLSMFDEDNKETHVGFCVLGGHFSEGIDLTNDKLIGVIIVGVGMPQIGIERDIIKDHMKDSNKGFDYAYVYPGMIKVLQAAGRCIRTDDDKGVILLLDNRYSQRRYQSLFPYEWYPNFRVRKSDDVKTLCEKFWRN